NVGVLGVADEELAQRRGGPQQANQRYGRGVVQIPRAEEVVDVWGAFGQADQQQQGLIGVGRLPQGSDEARRVELGQVVIGEKRLGSLQVLEACGDEVSGCDLAHAPSSVCDVEPMGQTMPRYLLTSKGETLMRYSSHSSCLLRSRLSKTCSPRIPATSSESSIWRIASCRVPGSGFSPSAFRSPVVSDQTSSVTCSERS